MSRHVLGRACFATLTFGLFLVLAVPAHAAPLVDLSPSGAGAGSIFTINGSGFDADEVVRIRWDGAPLGGVFRADGNGTFSVARTVPVDATTGLHVVAAVGQGSCCTATASFMVTVPGTTTTAPATTTTTAPATTTSTTPPTTTTTSASTTTLPATTTSTTPPTTVTTIPSTTTATAPTSTVPLPPTVPAATSVAAGEATLTTFAPSGSALDTGAPATSLSVAADGSAPTINDGNGTTGATQFAATPSLDNLEAVAGNQKGAPRSSVVLINPSTGDRTGVKAAWPVWSAVVGGVSLGFLVLLGALWLGRHRRQAATGRDANDPPVGAASTDSFVLATIVGEMWRPLRLDAASIGGTRIEALTEWRNSLWAVGRVAGGEHTPTSVVYSANGEATWNEVFRFDGLTATGIAAGGGGLVIVGVAEAPADRELSGAGWHTDDGLHWRPLFDGGIHPGGPITDVAMSNHAIAISSRGAGGGEVWSRARSGQWASASDRGPVDFVGATSEGLVAIGRDATGTHPLILASTDGTDWDPVPQRGQHSLEAFSASALVEFDGGLVAGGTDLRQRSASAWVSDDGRLWYRTPFPSSPGTSIRHVVATPDGLIAVGLDHTEQSDAGRGTVVLWRSPDLIDWEPLAAGGVFENAVIGGAVVYGRTVYLAGTVLDGGKNLTDGSNGAIWALDLGDETTTSLDMDEAGTLVSPPQPQAADASARSASRSR